jgi:hypothetical protein
MNLKLPLWLKDTIKAYKWRGGKVPGILAMAIEPNGKLQESVVVFNG